MNYQGRTERLLRLLEAGNLDGMLISDKSNIFYLSGFDGDDSCLVISRSEQVLVTDSRFTSQAEQQAPFYKIHTYSGKIGDGLRTVIDAMKIRRLGYEASNLTVDKFEEYEKLFQLVEMSNFDMPMTGFRAIKDEDEITKMRRAVKIADDAFDNILKFIRPGVTELDISAEMEYFMVKHGATGNSFPLIVAAGERASMPHASPTEKIIANGDVLKLDFGCVCENYCSDITRTIFVGKPNPELKRIYEIVLKSELLALDAVRSGVNVKDLDMTARNHINENGYEGKFLHGLGHGVGIDIHEYPNVSFKQDVLLLENMAITIEPGIYVAGLGGVRIEDIVIVKDGGAEILTSAPKNLIII